MDPLSMASTALSSMGHLFSGIMSFNGDQAQAKQYANAARQAGAEGGVNAQLALQRGDQTAADAAVQSAANGGGFTGSSLGVINNLASQAMFNARTEAYKGASQAQQDLYMSKVERANAWNGLIGGVIGAGGAAAGGVETGMAQSAQISALQSLKGLGEASPYDFMTLG